MSDIELGKPSIPITIQMRKLPKNDKDGKKSAAFYKCYQDKLKEINKANRKAVWGEGGINQTTNTASLLVVLTAGIGATGDVAWGVFVKRLAYQTALKGLGPVGIGLGIIIGLGIVENERQKAVEKENAKLPGLAKKAFEECKQENPGT